MRHPLLPILAVAGLGALAGCAYPDPQHVNALNALVGKSETDLVRARGVPSKTYETGGLKFMAYDMHRIDSLPGDAGFYPGFGYGGFGYGGFGGFGYGGFGGFGPEIVQRDCSTTFELRGGIVQRWSLRGNDC